jgi:subtilisin-like proprotein convertase family protein
MKFLSFARLFGERGLGSGSSRRQRPKRGQPARRREPRRIDIEALEDRTLPASLPLPVIFDHTPIATTTVNTTRAGNLSAPVIAVDPVHPNKLVAAFVRNDPANTIDPQDNNPPHPWAVRVELAYSTDAGTSWTVMTQENHELPLNQIDPVKTVRGTNTLDLWHYQVGTDPHVAFDRADDVYLLESQRSTDGVSGSLVLFKFNFSGASPSYTALPNQVRPFETTAQGKAVYTWVGDQALEPTLAVDNSLPTFQDPTTLSVQNDPRAGNVYVAWATNDVAPQGGIINSSKTFDPNIIKLIASNDGAATFTDGIPVNDGVLPVQAGVIVATSTHSYFIPGEHFGDERDTAPVVTVSQGRSDGTVPGGQLTIAWDDFGSGAGENPPTDWIRTDHTALSSAAAYALKVNVGGNGFLNLPITQAGITTDTLSVTAPANFGSVTDLEVTVAMVHPTLSKVELDLIPPAGSGFSPITLFQQQPSPNPGDVGISGTNLGLLDSGFDGIGLYFDTANPPQLHVAGGLGTTFDPHAARNIIDRGIGSHFVGHFLPELGSLTQFYGMTRAQLTSAPWTLEIVDGAMPSTTPPPQYLVYWSLSFTSGLTTNPVNASINTDVTAAKTTVRGSLLAPYPLKTTASPDIGVGPGIVIASDNTLGSFSPYEGRIYIAYTDRRPDPLPPSPVVNPADNTDIYLISSDNGGLTWTNRTLNGTVNDDLASQDGYSDSGVGFNLIAGRPQYEPAVAVDPSTGTVVVTYYDARQDAARARVARTIATSIDGGRTFGPQTFLNTPNNATDEVTRRTVTLGPIPDNDSTGNANRDTTLGFGIVEGLAVDNGHVYAAWAGNQNGGFDGKELINIMAARALIANGPRALVNSQTIALNGQSVLISPTMGPVMDQKATPFSGPVIDFNNQTDPTDGTPLVNGFVVYFDRPTDPNSFDSSDVTIVYRNSTTSGLAAGSLITSGILVTPVVDETSPLTPAQQAIFGPSKYLVTFTPQRGVGTYSYTVGPNISDRIRRVSATGTKIPGHFMDQDQSTDPGILPTVPNDIFAVPTPLNSVQSWTGSYFTPPFSQDTLPLIVPGPHVVSVSQVNQVFGSPDHLVLNNTVSSLDFVFDRDMDPTSFTPASVLRLIGPVGLIGPNGAVPASFKITPNPFNTDPNPNFPRTYRVGFFSPDGSQPLVLNLNGTYTITLASSIKSKAGDALDTNLNVGVDLLRDTPTLTTTTPRFNSTDVPKQIGGPNANTVTDSQLVVTDNFVMTGDQGLTVTLNATYRPDTDLTAVLIAPDGVTRITLFSGVGQSNSQGGFVNTVLDDYAGTSITAGGPPFTGRFQPQQALSDLFANGPIQSAGTWTLEITDSGTNTTGQLTGWSLQLPKPVPATGLGELVADQVSASFRIFTMDPTNPLSHQTWTSVGPASINGGGGSGRIGGLAVDPSDPSGNTVYVGGASGGIWKSTNFLTASPQGPTYIPLTDFGPTFGINIGSIAVFGRNSDPNQSIVFASTGEGDTGSRGVGFLRSIDGGATWTLLDSTNNVDAAGNVLPMNSPQRDHIFVGTTSFKVLVDPRPTPSGNVIVYAALSGTNGGIWKSSDSGNHWSLMRAGQATDVVFDPNSGHVNTISNPTGNLDVIYAGFAGDGVYISPNRGGVWNELLGGVGDPLIQDRQFFPSTPIPVNAPSGTPNGAKGRIVLAKPALTGTFLPDGTYVGGDAVKDLLYEGWLYALVTTPSGHFDGLYMTKDFGQNWTKVRLPDDNGPPVPNGSPNLIPTNDPTSADYDLFSPLAGQGNYDTAMAIDPTNPNIVYVGGTHDFQPTGLLRVDTTDVADAHAFALSDDNKDGGQLLINTTSPVALKNWPSTPGPDMKPLFSPYLNLIRPPGNPFNASATFYVSNTLDFANDGTGAKWIPFDLGGTDQHRWITIRDPLTGHSRLIIGDDQGVWTAVDINGQFSSGIGTAPFAGLSRNGNLQITQFYYGASQPSSVSAQAAAALFYGSAQDDGFPQSDPNILTNGNLNWQGPGGDGGGIATNQTGIDATSGAIQPTLYTYKWPCCGGQTTNFFQVATDGQSADGVGRTFGLIQQSGTGTVPDPQWPFEDVLNFAVNPIDGDQAIISSDAGRIFGTSDQGRTWLVIGDPTALDGRVAKAFAFGAPDPNDPSGALNDFLYVGTQGGHIFVTFSGGGANGNQWLNLSAGLDGSAVRSIVTNPTRGSHEAYAVTNFGVYHMVDSTAQGATWVNITSNLFSLTHTLFAPKNDANPLTDTQARYLETIQADWRYAIPNNPAEYNNPVNPPGPTHPVLYVGGEGGVYRSVDNGVTWTLFPNQADDGAPQEGGYLPNAHVTVLSLALGNIDPTNGRPLMIDPASGTPGPDVLLASTYGRGSFAIRVAPVLVHNSLALDQTSLSGPNTTRQLQPLIDGMSEQSAFGNHIKIQLLDANGNIISVDPNTPSQPFTFTDQNGRFKVQIKPGFLKFDGSSDGLVTVYVRATDAAGAIGPAVPFTFILDTVPAILSAGLDPSNPPPAGSDSGRSPTDGITNINKPFIAGMVSQAGPTTPIQIFDITNGPSTTPIGSGNTDATGHFSIQITSALSDGAKILQVKAVHTPAATPFTFNVTIDTTPPATPPAPGLVNDNGSHTTNNSTPSFTGTGEPDAQVILKVNGNRVDVGVTLVDGQGNYTVQVAPVNALANGNYSVTVALIDIAGNVSQNSPAFHLTILNRVLPTPTIVLDPKYNVGLGTDAVSVVIPQVYEGTSLPGTTVVINDSGVPVDGPFVIGSSGTFTQTIGLADGVHFLTVVETDQAGNTQSSAPYKVTVDTRNLDPDRKFIRALYYQALGRPGTLAEWDGWLGYLSQTNGRFIVANDIERSPEARERVVTTWYQMYLGRSPRNGEETGLVNFLVNGGTEEQALAVLLAQPEYFQHAPSIPGVGGGPATNTTFIKALYIQLLGRAPGQAEITAWLNLIPSQGLYGVASSILHGAEYRGIVVKGLYLNLLRRQAPPSQDEINFWVNSGIDFTSMRIDFEASPEFFFRVTGFLPT